MPNIICYRKNCVFALEHQYPQEVTLLSLLKWVFLGEPANIRTECTCVKTDIKIGFFGCKRFISKKGTRGLDKWGKQLGMEKVHDKKGA